MSASDDRLFLDSFVRRKPDRAVMASVLPSERSVLGLAWCFTALLSAILAILLLGKFRELESATGILTQRPGPHRVISPASASITEIFVRQGDAVLEGQLLARLQTDRFNRLGLPVRERELNHLRAQQNRLLQEATLNTKVKQQESIRIGNRRSALKEQLASVGQELSLLDAQLVIATQAMAATESLALRGGIARIDADQRRSRVLDLQRQRQSLIAESLRGREELTSLDAEASRIQTTMEQTALRLDQRNEELDYHILRTENDGRYSLVAPATGVVGTVALAEGAFIREEQSLFVIEPAEAKLVGEVFVPARIASRLELGQHTMLRLDAYDYRTYGRQQALVTEIDASPLDPREYLLPLPRLSEPVFRVQVELGSRAEGIMNHQMSPGDGFVADFVFEERALITFILGPLLALRGRLL